MKRICNRIYYIGLPLVAIAMTVLTWISVINVDAVYTYSYGVAYGCMALIFGTFFVSCMFLLEQVDEAGVRNRVFCLTAGLCFLYIAYTVFNGGLKINDFGNTTWTSDDLSYMAPALFMPLFAVLHIIFGIRYVADNFRESRTDFYLALAAVVFSVAIFALMFITDMSRSSIQVVLCLLSTLSALSLTAACFFAIRYGHDFEEEYYYDD